MFSSTSSGGWTCSRCTFFHHASTTARCAMCGELRVSKAQMRDFIAGKPINQETQKQEQQHQLRKESAKDPPIQRPLPSFVAKKSCIGTSSGRQDRCKENNSVLSNPYSKRIYVEPVGKRSTQYSTAQPQRPAEAKQRNDAARSVPGQQRACNNNQIISKPQQGCQPILGPITTTSDRKATAMQPTKKTLPSLPLWPQTREGARVPSSATARRKSISVEYTPGPVPFDPNTTGQWIFPTSEKYPVRQYQLDIAQTAVMHNTLVSLPTGLGKTLIAAVVVYNYYRWFPTGKVLFLAPTLPLVNQQVQACYEIMGIAPEETAVLTGKTPSAKRLAVWACKRVFFCTPQTVQKDLDNLSVFDARKVVCVVLDEAHKASGHYAYVKVVEKLKQVGAKFCITGLSATPGTNIKSIQQVVDVLDINKIEARQDTDIDVKPYIHERLSEIVIVKAAAATKPVLYTLNNLIGPVLERIRSMGGFNNRLTGSATLTAYSIWMAKDLYAKRCVQGNEEQRLTGWFLAAHKLVQMRDDLHKHGVGMLRIKMLRLKNEPQRGMMATIVKKKEFQELWEKVVDATHEPGSTQRNGIKERIENNPKLAKLREILIEHFERREACSVTSTTRAIVFSQFRDSVSEIVSILEDSKPLIRPRHFVGQGKGSSKETTCNERQAPVQVKGMKQAEQHEVIRQFRSNVYNVLVCTCIGEEGLDIGQVDLIINFDTLRSPIRMIQRTGRTGRARRGRVVCLVAEGQEERTFAASKQSERNLAHALKNPRAFRVSPTVPLFPTKPILCKRNMLVTTNFHASQVEGHQGQRRKMNTMAFNSVRQKRHWNLSEIEEEERAATLGKRQQFPVFDECPASRCNGFPNTLLRRFIVARNSSATVACSRDMVINSRGNFGRTASLLYHIEERYFSNGNTSVPSRKKRARPSDSALEILFPLSSTRSLEESCCMRTETSNHSAAVPSISRTGELSPGHKSAPTASPLRDNLTNEAHVTNFHGQSLSRSRRTATGMSVREHDVLLTFSAEVKSSKDRSLVLETSVEHSQQVPKNNPELYYSRCDHHSMERSGASRRGNLARVDDKYKEKQQSTETGPAKSVSEGSTCAEKSAAADYAERISSPVTTEEFRLPTQSDMSSSSSEDEQEEEKQFPHNLPDCQQELEEAHNTMVAESLEKAAGYESLRVARLRLPTNSNAPSSSEGDFSRNSSSRPQQAAEPPPTNVAPELVAKSTKNDCSCDIKDRTVDPADEFRLPTPDPSSSEQEDSEEEDVIESSNQFGTDRLPKQYPYSNDLLPSEDSEEDSPQIVQIPRRKRIGRKVLAIEDTPISGGSFTASSVAPCEPGSANFHEDLQDTQPEELHADDIVCAICSSGDFIDEDPILLCDGPGNGFRCDVAVHLTCYSANVDLNSDDAWRCDSCQCRYNGDNANLGKCSICHRSDGALKRFRGNEWKHLRCPVLKENNTGNDRPKRKRLKRNGNKGSVEGSKEAGVASGQGRQPSSALTENEDLSAESLHIKRRRRYRYNNKFIDEEAAINSEDDVEGDEDEDKDVVAIEEQEALENSFINDSSQLGFSQNDDELAKADRDAAVDDVFSHHAVDRDRELAAQFATPMFNRRMRRQNNGMPETPNSAPESEKGLGKMNFIRSVLEHHRKGGRAEDIEAAYRELEEE